MKQSLSIGITLRVLAAGLVGGTLAVIGAVAPAQASPWEFAGAYPTDAACHDAGESGVATGEWPEYQCVLFEGLHDLYVRTP
jgi:hypothetical protein